MKRKLRAALLCLMVLMAAGPVTASARTPGRPAVKAETETESETETAAETEGETAAETEGESETETETETELPALVKEARMDFFNDRQEALKREKDLILPSGSEAPEETFVFVRLSGLFENLLPWQDCSFEITAEKPLPEDAEKLLDQVRASFMKEEDWLQTGTSEYSFSFRLPADIRLRLRLLSEGKDPDEDQVWLEETILADRKSPEVSVVLQNERSLYGRDENPAFAISCDDGEDGAGMARAVCRLLQGDQPVWEQTWEVAEDQEGPWQTVAVPEISGDGQYHLELTAFDRAGLSTSYISPELTVDRTAPKVSCRMEGGPVLSGYYGTSKTLTFTVTDVHWDMSREPVCYGSAGGSAYFSGWQTTSEGLTGELTLEEEGSYEISFECTDAAGNRAEPLYLGPIVIDRTPPDISLDRQPVRRGDKSMYLPVFSGRDDWLDASSCRVSLRPLADGTGDTRDMYSFSYEEGRLCCLPDQAADAPDGIYQVEVRMSDLAGNSSVSSALFTINRSGSAFSLDEAGMKIAREGIMDRPMPLSVTESNLDYLENRQVLLSHAGTLRTLKEGTDYQVRESAREDQRKYWTYTLDPACFEEEGDYTVHIRSLDLAGNEADSQMRGAALRFLADYSPPVLTVRGIEDGGFYEGESKDFILLVSDRIWLKRLTCLVDGEDAGVFTGEDAAKSGGSFHFSLKSSSRARHLTFLAEDLAGHRSEPLHLEVTVTAPKAGDEEKAADAEGELLIMASDTVLTGQNKATVSAGEDAAAPETEAASEKEPDKGTEDSAHLPLYTALLLLAAAALLAGISKKS